MNLQRNDGWSPLHCASSEGHVDIVRALAEAGAKLSLQAAKLRVLADAVVLRDL